MRKIVIFDTTLRDGEQSPGAALNVKEKLEIARQLARLKVDVIEAGFPISSPEDFEAVRLISEEIEGPIICGLSRAVAADIDECGKALAKARRSRIHTGIGISDIHIAGKFRDKKYGKTIAEKKAKILQMSVEAVKRARDYTDDVEFYAEDAGRADRTYLFEVIQAVIEAGATVINIPDTTGYTVPEQFGALIRDIRTSVPNIHQATISVHCHDDLGIAVANALSSVKNGAQQIECTINGVGERAGNTSLEEVVMALKVRRDFFDADTDIVTQELYPTSRLVSRLMGFPVPPNKAIVGANAFAHSSGIHQDGVLKERTTYEIMRPEDVGIHESKIILSPRSGRHALRHRLSELGHDLSDEQLNKAYERFLEVADKKKEVFDEDLVAIVEDELSASPEVFSLEYIQITSGTRLAPTATVGLRKDVQVIEEAAHGDGPVDAAYKAIDRITGAKAELVDYNLRAVTGGKDAIGEVTVRIKSDGRTVVGRGASTDIIEASAKAYLNAINKLLYRG